MNNPPLLDSPQPTSEAVPADLQSAASEHERRIQALETQLIERDRKIAEADQTLAHFWRIIVARDREIAEMRSSWEWRMGQRIMQAGRALAAPFLRIGRSRFTRGLLRRLVPRPVKDYYHAFRTGYPLTDLTQVFLYADPSILPGYSLRVAPNFHPLQQLPQNNVALVTSAFNQAAGIQSWLESLHNQSRLPNEAVIADRGSTDGTVNLIQAFAQSSPIPIHLVDAAGKNTAEALNLAIQNTTFPLIASTETVCTPEKDWLRNLLGPLEADPNMKLSAGFFQARAASDFQRLCTHIMSPHPQYINPQSFLPSWRSIALRKSLWIKADGCPEWLGDTSGERLFAYQAKQHPGLWAVVPDARVLVDMPGSLADLYRFCYQEGQADGITGIEAARYWDKTLKLAGIAILAGFAMLSGVLSSVLLGHWGWIVPGGLLVIAACAVLLLLRSVRRNYQMGIKLSVMFLLIRLTAALARLSGFAAGVRARPSAKIRQSTRYQNQLQQILDQHPQRKGIVVYPPTHDWGYMFQLPQQMARQLAKKGYLYFYCTVNEKTDDVFGFRTVEPNLYLCNVPLETFGMLERPIVYIGSPWNRKALEFFNRPVIIYDHYDDLAVSSGRLEDHQHLLQKADIVLVTSQRLLDNVKGIRADTIFAPNGVDYEYFRARRPALDEAAPLDLQPVLSKGKPVIGYTGVLSERFDYDLFLLLVQSRPNYEFVLIGANYDGSLDRSGLLKAGLDNVCWLGMKSHEELVKYIWRFQAGIVPFKINEITLATTSIKVFEYMACKVPVVSVAMPESKRYPGVFIAETYEQFVEHLDAALRAKTDDTYLTTIDQVARVNTWENRADKIITRVDIINRA